MPVIPVAGTERDAPGATVTGQLAGADLTPGTVLADRFVVSRLLGIGGMGVVYLARDRALDVDVAVKLLRPELASRPEAFDRFRQELLLARQVSSPNVVRIHDISSHAGRWFISMDYVEGESLDRRLDRLGTLSVQESLAIARQLAMGLAAAHAVGIVHRDLKPSNVLIDSAGNARISDFGVARSLGTSGLTQSGAIVGTPDYLSPEQARGTAIDARSDLYALGLILYEMLSGQQPFGGGTPAESLTQRLVRPPPPVDAQRRDVPAWAARLVERLLQPRPSRRFNDAQAVVAAIEQQRVARDLRPGPRSLAAAAALILALAVLAWWRFAPSPVPAAADARPPERVVVLAEGAPGRADPLLEAWAESLRLGLNAQAGLSAVDAERTQLAQVQAGFGGAAPASDADLLAVLPATRVLHLGLQGAGAERRLTARLGPEEMPTMSARAPADQDPAPAFTELSSAIARALGHPAPAPHLPADPALVLAYGEALQLRRSGRAEQAAAAFRQVAEQAPESAAVWLGLAEALKVAGQRPLSLEAARRGLALPGSPLGRDFARWVAMAEGRADEAMAAQAQWIAQRPDDLDAQVVLAEMRIDAGEFEAAADGLRALLERDGQDPRAWFLLGKSAILHGEPRQAVEDHLVRALVLYKRGRSTFGEAETTNAMGVAYSRLGQVEDAGEQYRKALTLRRELGDRRGVASSLRNLAQLAMIRGEFEEAQASLDEASSLFAALGDNSGAAAVDNELGLLAEERGNYVAALAAYKRALRGREQSSDAQGSAESLNNIGFAHYQLGDYDNARVFWRQARDAFAALDDRNGMVRADQNLGLLEIARGDWDASQALLESSLREAESRHMLEEAAVSRRNLAELHWNRGRLDEAWAQLQKARALFQEREDQRGLVDADLLEARLLTAAGNGVGALARLDRLQPTLQESSMEQRAIASLLRAELLMDAGRAAEATKMLARARTEANESGVRVLRLRADVLGGQGADPDLDQAVTSLGNAPLLLLWHERRIAQGLDAGDAPAAAAFYRLAREAPGARGNFLRAERLHSLGARALAAAGAPRDAEDAERRAVEARAALQSRLPPELKADEPLLSGGADVEPD
jgi:tetratricopeptide (TPR) repeat protein